MTVQFVPGREFWFVSAFVNAAAVDPYAKAAEIGALVEKRLRALTPDELPHLAYRPELVERAVAMARSITIRCTWNPYVDGFPFHDENTGLHYNKLGHFELEVEYFNDEPQRRAEIEPILVQQPPTIAAAALRQFAALKASSALRLDTQSPIYVMVVAEECRPEPPPWTTDNVRAHKRSIGPWVEVYSGAWPDYTEELFDRRVEHNLSNRTSEIHLLRKNSGFLYLAPDNMRRFFDGYMRPYVLAPTAQLRAMHFALLAINESVDILLMRQAREDFQDVAVIEEKLRSLRQLRAALHMKMSDIYNELDSNKRQHHAAVLRQALQEFNLTPTGIFGRVADKFEALQEGLVHLYQRQETQQQARNERRLTTLNTLFSLGVFADFAALLLGTAGGLQSGDSFATAINGVFSAILLVVLALAIAGRIRLRLEDRRPRSLLAAEALVLDAQGRVLVITRKNPPCRGQRAFPGTLVLGKEPAAAALVREVKDETNLEIAVERLLGTYPSGARDPRGRVVSQAYLCRLRSDARELRCREDAGEGRFVPPGELVGEDLAFDHEDMLADAITQLQSRGS